MSNFALTLQWERCPDGALFESATPEEPGFIRYRSDRREAYSRRLENADDLVALNFLNTLKPSDPANGTPTEDETNRLLGFVDEHGLPFENEPGAINIDQLLTARSRLGILWSAYETGDKNLTATEFRKSFGLMRMEMAKAEGEEALLSFHVDAPFSLRGRALVPDLQFKGSDIILTMQASTLYAFMLLETGLVISNGSEVQHCDYCANTFVTGTGTGRRNTSRYCSARCRVAAQRQKRDANVST